MKLLTRVLFSLLIGVATASAAEVPKEPEAMVEYFLRQTMQFNFDGIAEHTHLDDAKRYKDLHVEAARLAEQQGLTLYFQYLITWADSSDEIKKMEPRKVYGAAIRGVFEMQRTKFPELYASMVKQAKAAKTEVIGHVMDGTEKMLVTYRLSGTLDGKPFSRVAVFPLRRAGEVWMLGIQDENFEQMNKTIGQLKKSGGKPADTAKPAAAPESKPGKPEEPQAKKDAEPKR